MGNNMAASSTAGNTDGSGSEDRYYCHKCSAEVENVGQDITCPTCHSGFLELITEEEDTLPGFTHPLFNTASTTSTSSTNAGPRSTTRIHISGGQGNAMDLNEFFRTVGFPMLFGGGGPMPSSSTASDTNRNPNSASGQSTASNTEPQVPFQTFLQQLFQSLTADGTIQLQFQVAPDGTAVGTGGNEGPTFFNLSGNLGDYAWGPNSLDAIVTQLLNQVEGGAPPMSKADLANLTETTVTQADVDRRQQCPVCFEDVAVGEVLKVLTCKHSFHPPCIIPWLERHNSCPVCRNPADTQSGKPPSSGTGGNGTGSGTSGTQGPGPSSGNTASQTPSNNSDRTNSTQLDQMEDYD